MKTWPESLSCRLLSQRRSCEFRAPAWRRSSRACEPWLLRSALLSACLIGSAHAQHEAAYAPLTDFSAPGAASLYGLCVAGGGDVDGDGVSDFAVGAPGVNAEDGRVYVYSAADGALLYGGPLTPVPPVGITGGHYQFGCGLDLSHDFNGDGKDDLIVGAQQNSGFTNRKGFVSLFDGATGTLITSWSGVAQDLLGGSVASGDVDGDGHPDVIAGARQGSGFMGHVVVYSGVAPYAQIFLHVSPSPTSHSMDGRSVASANVNGDAYADILVGADEAGSGAPVGPGFVQVLLGPAGTPAAWGTRSGTLVGDRFGFALANAGNVAGDGDDFDDILVGAPQNDSAESIGYAMLVDGLTGTPLRTFQGEQPKDYFGVSVAGGLDFNADGFVDFVIGANQEQATGKRGYVRVHSGKPGLDPPFLYRREGDKASVPNAGSGVGIGRSVAATGNAGPLPGASFVTGSSVYAGVGHVEVIVGRDLLLTVLPDSVSLGEIVTLVTAQMPATTPVVLLAGLPPAPTTIHPVLGVALLPTPLVIAWMDMNESLLLAGTAPVSLLGLQVLVQCAAKKSGESVRVSDIQTINF